MRIHAAVLLTCLCVPAGASAHMVITSPTPRVAADNIKEAAAPCGGPRGSTIHQLNGGDMMTIEFDETIAHPGHFELKFSMEGDTRWQTLDADIPDQGDVGSYSHTFEIPDVNCTDCTFQFIQVMTDRNPPTNYYNCIDVAITSSAGPDPDMGSGGVDMGTAVDMGSTNGATTNPGTGQTGGGGNTTGAPTTPDPATNMGAGGTTNGQDDSMNINGTGTACSVAGSGRLGDGLLLLGVVFGVTRRRRSSRGSSEAR